MRFLAIETSCDETSLAIFHNKNLISHTVASSEDLHKITSGVVPEVASRAHLEVIFPLLNNILIKSKTKLNELDAIAVTSGPGLMGSLMVGVEVAKTLGSVLKIPVHGINHLEGHLCANFKDKEWPFPIISLIVSGGHTMMVLMNGHGEYKTIGETLDDSAGEAFDKVAKMLGLGYPGGPAIEKTAVMGDKLSFVFPRGLMYSKDYNFSFSGLKTAVLNTIIAQNNIKNVGVVRNMAASFQWAVVDVLARKASRAVKEFRPKTLMLGGGVAANKELRSAISDIANIEKIKFSVPKFELCTDNAAMIGVAAYYRFIKGYKPKKIDVKSVWPLGTKS